MQESVQEEFVFPEAAGLTGDDIPFEMFSESPFVVEDPGDGNEIVIDRWGAVVPVSTLAGETRTLARPTRAGVLCTVVLERRAGNLVLSVDGVYGDAGSITFSVSGECVTLLSVLSGGVATWRVIGWSGTSLASIGSFTNVYSDSGVIKSLHATTGYIPTLQTTNGYITTVNATTISFGTSSSDKLTKAALNSLLYVAGATAGVASASRAVVLGSGGDVTWVNGGDISFGTTTGTKIGTSSSQKIAFWGSSPVVRPASADQAALGATSIGYGSTPLDRDDVVAEIDAIKTLVNQLRSDLVEVGLIKGSA